MKLGLLILCAVFAGALVSVQGAMNSQLGRFLSHPLQAALISFVAGTIGLLLALFVLNVSLPTLSQLQKPPSYLLFGGIFGAFFITLSVFTIPKIGIANFVIAIICGEIFLSLVLDHFGFFGLNIKHFSWQRFIGVLLVISGVYIINKDFL